MKRLLTYALLAGLATVSSVWAADGATLYQQKGCTACHGPAGDKPLTDAYPKLAGQNAQYLFSQMKDIKSGARDNGQTAIMKPIIASVSEDQMQAIATWLSTQPAQ